MSKRQILNQFLFEEGQDAYKYGIGSSEHLLVDKHQGVAKYGKKPVCASIKQMPQLVSWSLPLSTNILYLFMRNDTVYALAENPNENAQIAIIQYDSDGGYAVAAACDDEQRYHLIAHSFCSCECGQYQFIMMRVLDGSLLLAFDSENNTLTEITLPKSGAIKATSICYWAGHLFINDTNNDKIWYSSLVLTATDISQIFTSNTYRSMGYKDGNALWVGVLNGALWSVSSSYVQKWTDSDSTLVPIYADTASITEMHTFAVLPFMGGILLASSDINGIKHLFIFDGKSLTPIETEELASLLNAGTFPNKVVSVSFEHHPLLMVQFSNYGTYAYDMSNCLWVKDSYWDNAIQVIQNVGIEAGSETRVSKIQIPNPGKNWSRLGSIWLDGNADFYCDRIALKVRASWKAASSTLTVKYRMRSLEGETPDFITETFTLGNGNTELQCMNCGYGNILDLKVIATGGIELYDVRAEITSGGRW